MDNIVFNCTTCNLGVVFNSEEHDHSACDESGDNWYCPNCIPDDDDDGLTWFETQVGLWVQEDIGVPPLTFLPAWVVEANAIYSARFRSASKSLITFQALFRGREVRWTNRVSKVAVVVQALVRGREVRWRYPLYALMS